MSVIGFDKQKGYFETLISGGGLSHAYLFSGPERIGKKQFTLELARMLNGREPEGDPDFKLLSPDYGQEETHISIDTIRKMKADMSRTAAYGPYKLALIDDADRLLEPAANALLKLLEEPSDNAVLFLITSKPSDLLSTIRSRCAEIRFLPHAKDAVRNALAGYELKPADEELLTLLADGRIGWAINCIREKRLPVLKKSIEEFQQVIRQGIFERLQFAKKIFESDDYKETVLLWIHWIRAYGKNPERTMLVLTKLLRLHQILSQPQFNHRLALENFLAGLT